MSATIAYQRLSQQRLSENPWAAPEEIVSWLGAVQSQEYPGAKWSLALRMPQTTEAVIDQAFNEGRILRTHMMRPTWHFVTPADIRWIMELTAHRVQAVNAYMYRQQGLDDALLARSNDVMAKALEGGNQLTRAELGVVLNEAGIDASKMRLGYIVHRAELDAVVCSGARRGKQFTYALLDERAPHAKRMERDEALAELTRRYFTSHGPATVHDFAWWSGLTVVDAKVGLEMAKSHLAQEEIDGKTYWFSEAARGARETSLEAILLPTYDEYVIGYTDRSALFEGAPIEMPNVEAGNDSESPTPVARTANLFEDPARGNIVFDSLILIDGKIVGSWRRTFSKGAVVIELKATREWTSDERDAVAAAAQRFGEFLGMPVVFC